GGRGGRHEPRDGPELALSGQALEHLLVMRHDLRFLVLGPFADHGLDVVAKDGIEHGRPPERNRRAEPGCRGPTAERTLSAPARIRALRGHGIAPFGRSAAARCRTAAGALRARPRPKDDAHGPAPTFPGCDRGRA